MFADIISLYLTTAKYLASKLVIEFGKNPKYWLLRRLRSFKVIEVGTNRKPVCDLLLEINSNWQPISYCCWVIAAYCSNYGNCVFEPPLELRDYVRCLSWKAGSGLPISDNWTFSSGVTVDAVTLRSRVLFEVLIVIVVQNTWLYGDGEPKTSRVMACSPPELRVYIRWWF